MTVTLTKGQKFELPSHVRTSVDLVWTDLPAQTVDLDLSCVLYPGTSPMEVVDYRRKRSRDGAVSLDVDATRGGHETITADLGKLSVPTLVFVARAYTHQRFDQLGTVRCDIYDRTAGTLAATFSLTGLPYTTVFALRLVNDATGCSFTALGTDTLPPA